MSRYIAYIALLAIALLLATPEAQAQESLNGAWQTADVWGAGIDGEEWRWEDPQPAMVIFTDGYYSRVGVNGSEPRPEPLEGQDLGMEGIANLSTDDLAAMLGRFFADAGTYTVNDSTITFDPMVAKTPRSTYETFQWEFEMKDGELHFSSTYDVNGGGVWNAKLMRLE